MDNVEALRKGVEDGESLVNEKIVTSPETLKAAVDPPVDPADHPTVELKAETVPYLHLFRFVNALDVTVLVIGGVCAVAAGATQPLFAVLFGQLIDAFGGIQAEGGDMLKEVRRVCMYFVYLAVGSTVVNFFEVYIWTRMGERQANRVRDRYLRSILRQEGAFFDIAACSSGTLLASIEGDTHLLQEAMGEKMGQFLHNLAAFTIGIGVALERGWELTLVILAVMPLLMAAGGVSAKLTADMVLQGQDSYREAGGVAGMVLGAMRTVAAFGGEKHAIKMYVASLQSALKAGEKQAAAQGMGIGLMQLILFSSYGLVMYVGGELIISGNYTGGDVFNVLFAVLVGGMALGQVSPNVAAFAAGKAAAAQIFKVIDNVPNIDIMSSEGLCPEDLASSVVLQNVHFRYPSRPEVAVLTGLSLTVHAGDTLALVGESGSGKSTVVALLERFYDPEKGAILLGGVNIKDLQLHFLRTQLGLVSQEPALFATSILQNISFGRSGATRQQAMDAAKAANVHDFVAALPDGYDTQVGERGIQLSGGQKQRIAIARAVLKDPKVLLLDEATSALDAESERMVQLALDQLMAGRTSIVVAHRLSTVREADQIAVMRHGEVVEQGTHSQLMAAGQEVQCQTEVEVGQELQGAGTYAALVHLQSKSSQRAQELASAASMKSLVDEPADDVSVVDEVHHILDSGTEEVHLLPAHGSASFVRLLYVVRPQWYLLGLGVLGCTLSGAVMPMMAVALSNAINDFYKEDDELREGVRMWALIFVGIGITALVSFFLACSGFEGAGHHLTNKVRELLFTAAVRQEMAWFDEEGNSSGALCARLETDASLVKGALTERTGTLVLSVATLVVGLSIAFESGWKLTLVLLACGPLIAISGWAQGTALTGFSRETKKLYESSSKVAADAVINVKAIQAFTLNKELTDLYCSSLQLASTHGNRQAGVAGVGAGFAQLVLNSLYAGGFYYGATLVDSGEYTFLQVLQVFNAVVLSTFGLANATTMAPNLSKAMAAAESIFSTVDRLSRIDPMDDKGDVSKVMGQGALELRDVHFAYPSRPEVRVLRGLSLSIPAGSSVAVVGESGSGKSTVISLIERFYDPSHGQVMLDGVDLRNLNLSWLRQQIGLVSQEPVLFQMSIRDNIAYGTKSMIDFEISEEAVINAAKAANAHSYITALPDGYNSLVGERGTQLSGGQKQRIAIARAILKNPKILLLDEATSALDSESERVVQEALDNLMVSRTSVVVAHRLTTIEGAQKIAVVKKGRVVEDGTHGQLLTIPNGKYAALIRARRCSE